MKQSEDDFSQVITQAITKSSENPPSSDYTEPVRVVSKAEWEWMKEYYPSYISETDGEIRFNGLRILVQKPLPTGKLYKEDKRDARIKQNCKEWLEATLTTKKGR